MDNNFIVYQGEHLLIGNLGHLFVVVSFITSLLAGWYYLKQSNKGLEPLTSKAPRRIFWVHFVSVVGIITTLFLIIQQHYFEYYYAYQHSSLSLPVYYMISCFWEGQEGSFLLWMFWNCVLGSILIVAHQKWESSVMAIICLAQAILSSMLLGIEVTDDFTIGSSPYILLREVMGDQAPIFSTANYLNSVVDGTGLNPLLQNYWMVIHPPTLFLGFASTLIPFAFAVTAIRHRIFRKWIQPALPWTLFSGMILGAGIIMGGFWAYESLSFGGYWAWDPVENASLIPWLLIIAGIHMMVIQKATGKHGLLALLFPILGFLLVLYATFLTRSGVLGNTSVHSFTDLGLSGQLIQFGALFFWLPFLASEPNKKLRLSLAVVLSILVIALPFSKAYLFYPVFALTLFAVIKGLINVNKMLPPEADDRVSSREFWMLIGSLVLVLSAIQVISTTSIPVFNKLFHTTIAPPVEVVEHYNRWQLPFAILIGLGTGLVQYLRYKSTDRKHWLPAVGANFAISIAAGFAICWALDMIQVGTVLMMIAAAFTIFGNTWFLFVRLKGNLSAAGGSITHIGFGLMLLGVLISGVKKRTISADMSGVLYSEFGEETARENVLLMKDQAVRMGDFMVTYLGDSIAGPNHYYMVNYNHIHGKDSFTLYPNAQISENQGLMPNPDTRHYLTYDVFTHVTSVPKDADETAWETEKEVVVSLGDTVHTSRGVLYFESVERGADDERLQGVELLSAVIKVVDQGKTYEMRPVYALTRESYFSIRDENEDLGLRLNFEIRPSEEGGTPNMFLEVSTRPRSQKYIVMKAIVFPFINLLWAGTIIMIIGFTVAMLHRRKMRVRS